jgi:xanthine dehydrogenase accessory factor
MRLDLLKKLNVERAARRPAVLITDLSNGAQRLATEDALDADPLAEALDSALRAGKSGTVEHAGSSYFLTVQAPPPRLIAIGAAHITQALAPMARVAGFDMTVVDPRTAFATPDRFPDVALVPEWPDVALPPMKLDRFTALACFTHDPKIDDPGLVLALRAKCFYIGALGSRKTHAKRLERLAAQGFSPEETARVRAPIGLDIGAVSPAEIAVSVLGEIILALRKKPLRTEKEKEKEKAA